METGAVAKPAGRALARGLELIVGGDPAERERGCALLGRASERDEAVRAEAAAALAALAERETDVRVLGSLARAIGNTCDPRAVPVLVALAVHPDAGVRREVAGAFAGVAGALPDGADVRALLALTRDADPRVRDWATFTLGFQTEADGPAIRAALWERTADEDADAREEGIRGLARRHDPRAVPLLAELLSHPGGAHVHTFDAARIMGVPELLPALLGYEPEGAGVAEAVEACDPVRRARLDALAWELVCTLHHIRPDLDAAVSMERFGWGLDLVLGAPPHPSAYDVEALLARADGTPTKAAALVTTDLPNPAPTT